MKLLSHEDATNMYEAYYDIEESIGACPLDYDDYIQLLIDKGFTIA